MSEQLYPMLCIGATVREEGKPYNVLNSSYFGSINKDLLDEYLLASTNHSMAIDEKKSEEKALPPFQDIVCLKANVYGVRDKNGELQYEIGFKHPETGEDLVVQSIDPIYNYQSGTRFKFSALNNLQIGEHITLNFVYQKETVDKTGKKSMVNTHIRFAFAMEQGYGANEVSDAVNEKVSRLAEITDNSGFDIYYTHQNAKQPQDI